MKVFDGHCDTISMATRSGDSIRRTKGHLDLERMGQYEGLGPALCLLCPYEICERAHVAGVPE